MIRMLRKNVKGFTLVEVIVVAVIVAVLALVAIQLYQGYVKEARKNTADNLASSAAGFLQSAYNATDSATVASLSSPLKTGEQWTVALPSGESIKFGCPDSATITISTDSVYAKVKDKTSKAYKWR